jgi:uroporphyrinogen decarboxylase
MRDSRERVLTTLDHREPDRVPRDYWAAPEVTERLLGELCLPDREALLRHFGVDLRYVAGPGFVGLQRRRFEDGSVEDLWGVRRKAMTVDTAEGGWWYQHVVKSPLAGAETAEDVERHQGWPSAEWWDYSSVAEECAAHAGCAVVFAGDRLDRTAQLKPAMYLRGTDRILMDMAGEPEVAEAILGRIKDYFLEYNRRVFEAAAGNMDIFMMGDDFGTQRGLYLSKEMWRRFLKPGFRAFIELAHRYGLKVMHHTCGAVRELIADFIECGLDILQSLQPQASGMDLRELKREFGRDLCFHGAIDVQGALPHGTPSEVREEVRRTMEAGRPGGGFIICTAHNILPDTPTANSVSLFEAYEEFGRYA